jgi:predicted nucleic acid-binding Zn ribbon protein
MSKRLPIRDSLGRITRWVSVYDVRGCYYCGRPIDKDQHTCYAHSDLPALDPENPRNTMLR